MPNNETAKTKSAPNKGNPGQASGASADRRTGKNLDGYGWRATIRRNYRGLSVFFFLLVIVCGAITLPFWVLRDNGSRTYRLTIGDNPKLPESQGRYGGVVVSRPWVYHLKGVYKEADLQKGLSGTKNLKFNQGMVFLFDKTASRCFWMKDMHYNLDIIWADSQKKITAIERDVAPGTYPKEFCHDAQFVIELNAGEADKNALAPGQLLNF